MLSIFDIIFKGGFMEVIYKNNSTYVDTLSTIIKDIERINIFITSLNIEEKIIFDKLKSLQRTLKCERDKTSLNGIYITMSDEYLEIEFVDYQNTLEINSKTDIMLGIENKILIKRNMREFYFYTRDIIHQVDEGTYITQKINNNWEKEHFIAKNGVLLYDHPEEEFNELLSEKIYMKGSKK